MKNYNEWLKESSKVNFLFELLANFHEENVIENKNNKILIFSKTKILLNFIETIMGVEGKNYNYLRLDGNVKI
jgi:SNF2 family DNA or RNA helicase